MVDSWKMYPPPFPGAVMGELARTLQHEHAR